MTEIALIGKKIGMTREFYKTGQSVPVTVLKIEKGRIIEVIDPKKRGYTAIQLGFGKIKNSKLTKAMKGFFTKKNTEPRKIIKEFLKIDCPISEAFNKLNFFFKKYKINLRVEKNYFPISKNKFSRLNIKYSASFGRQLEYYTGLVFKIDVKIKSNKINSFVNPNELFLTMLSNPKDNLLGSLSLLEKYNSLKRCRHLIESWGSQRLKTLENCISILIDNPSSGLSETNKEIDDLFKDLNSDAIKFQELYYLERQHMNFLDKQRCGNFVAS